MTMRIAKYQYGRELILWVSSLVIGICVVAQSSGKGSGKGSGKTSMEGSGEGPVKSSHAEGMFPGLQQFGNGSMGMPDSMVCALI